MGDEWDEYRSLYLVNSISKAKDGDKESIEFLARWASKYIAQQRPFPLGLRNFMVNTLTRISEGKEPNKVFGTKGKTKQRMKKEHLREEIVQDVCLVCLCAATAKCGSPDLIPIYSPRAKKLVDEFNK